MATPSINIFNFGPILAEVAADVSQILTNQGTQMSALTDLQAAVTNLTNGVASITTAVNQAVTLLQQAAAGNTVDPTDAENAVAAINQAVTNLATETMDLTSASAPPPAAAPTSP